MQDLATSSGKIDDDDDMIAAIPRPAGDNEDLTEYKFQKYAATYFQGNVNHQYSRKNLKQPLLNLQHQGDQLVSKINVFIYLISLLKYLNKISHILIYNNQSFF